VVFLASLLFAHNDAYICVRGMLWCSLCTSFILFFLSEAKVFSYALKIYPQQLYENIPMDTQAYRMVETAVPNLGHLVAIPKCVFCQSFGEDAGI